VTFILLLALVCFLVAAIGHFIVRAWWVGIGWLGLFFLALAALWPLIKLN
jgi:hypothetical protein